MNILIIPHSPEYRFIHNRCHEIAQGLVDIGHNVYFLEWQTCKNRHIYTLIKSQIINLFLPSFCLDETKIKYIRIPILNLNRGSFFFSFIKYFIVLFTNILHQMDLYLYMFYQMMICIFEK